MGTLEGVLEGEGACGGRIQPSALHSEEAARDVDTLISVCSCSQLIETKQRREEAESHLFSP